MSKILDRIISDKFIDISLNAVFSKISLIIHTIWFIVWFWLKLDVGLLTNIVSLEAIYVGVLIGIQQLRHHKSTKKLHDKIDAVHKHLGIKKNE